MSRHGPTRISIPKAPVIFFDISAAVKNVAVKHVAVNTVDSP